MTSLAYARPGIPDESIEWIRVRNEQAACEQEQRDREEREKQTTRRFVEHSCFVFNADMNKVYSRSRRREVAIVRQLTMTMVMSVFGRSQEYAAMLFGRNHATAFHAKTCVMNCAQTDKAFRAKVEKVCTMTEIPSIL